ncbi:ABC-F family ATP-binding cassette domain-containing protein [Acidocella aminolytica]|jgi:ATP-binding cassette subfamily F protein 3|uniref:ABC transporter n=1 Tax=Acidocella aminolytica 101 = DSM 11237 TaxID=1120923 RepID=A0A0D6PKN8_9PROT|nr:ABC-F family ATP-binding cassette domain-containing protein [Acidocella aminolytica]GAN81309.1 ABC transporter [Acidocella aminolytica 101 = DSM 11237]GBQ36961.1 ABC transporter ATP-binding protein [Acidocella aminolytica 101 = DSM 11237]SHE83007.1 ATP-binding cassette, subfamily F, member 3 [Acidocella aminolytica 101 = DSM 11237]
MSVLRLEDLSYAIAGRPLLEHAELLLDEGKHVGLIGRNGAGKSTLLKLIAGGIQPDGGKVMLGNRVRLGYVAQEAPGGDVTPLDVVLAADVERAELLHSTEHPETPAERLAEIHERLLAIRAESAPARAASILAGLGFNEDWQARPMSSYSGGWRMRVALAAVLFSEPDLLLLDEPTNHLDLEATLWLEGYLQKFPGAILLVSHDRQLLDKAVEATVHLDNGKLTMTPGGFAEFVRIKTERALQQARAAERVAVQRAHMQAFVDRFRAKATKARQAQSRLKALEKLPQIDAVVEGQATEFSFPSPEELPPPMLQLEGVEIGYDGKAVLSGVSLRIDMEDRIALLGQNGNGKSTLAKLLAGRLAAMRGREFRVKGLRVGYFAQHQEDDLVLTDTPYDHLARALPQALPPQIRAQAARFGLDADRVNTPVGQMSGGEKARLLLALATRDAPHLLILDEPTNHLDIDARDALIKALTDFEGAVVLISHDPYLVELAADRLVLVAKGKVTPFEGDLAAYAATMSERGAPAQARKVEEKKNDKAARAEARARLAPLQKAAKAAETALNKLTAEKETLEAKLADEGIYAPAKAVELNRITLRLGALKSEIEAAEMTWLEAAEALEAAA